MGSLFSGLLSAIGNAVGAFFGWKQKKLEIEQSAPMVAGKKAEQDRAVIDKTQADLDRASKGDLSEIRKDLAE